MDWETMRAFTKKLKAHDWIERTELLVVVVAFGEIQEKMPVFEVIRV